MSERGRVKRPVHADFIDKSSAIPVYFQLLSMLERKIVSGELRPGEKLPSERQMAEMFDISPMTVNKALSMLASNGLVIRERGRGTFVKSGEIEIPPTLLRGLSKRIREQGLRLETKVLRKGITSRALPVIADRLRLGSHEKILEIRRLWVIEKEPIAITTAYLPYKYSFPLLREDLTQSLTDLLRERCGIVLIRAEENIGVCLAKKYEAEVLKVRRGAPLLLVEGVSFTEGGIPVRYTRGLYRGDKFKFSIQHGSLEEIGSDRLRRLRFKL